MRDICYAMLKISDFKRSSNLTSLFNLIVENFPDDACFSIVGKKSIPVAGQASLVAGQFKTIFSTRENKREYVFIFNPKDGLLCFECEPEGIVLPPKNVFDVFQGVVARLAFQSQNENAAAYPIPNISYLISSLEKAFDFNGKNRFIEIIKGETILLRSCNPDVMDQIIKELNRANVDGASNDDDKVSEKDDPNSEAKAAIIQRDNSSQGEMINLVIGGFAKLCMGEVSSESVPIVYRVMPKIKTTDATARRNWLISYLIEKHMKRD
ncbi:hypothetical protein VA599_23645 [Chromobacterium sp. TRC.1.1.SA]|uniref:DUF4747 domain-containing protein n=1 Tax=Chromobacterium indicum TaxID=3110228 RepID=A0ABV0CS40_9NEIS